jgi:ribosome-associated heat shock protein Hsp15
MRVDKFLWCVRVFKTRTLATEHCRSGKVFVGEHAVKPAMELKGGECIRVRMGAVHFSWEVLEFPPSRVGAAGVPTYVRDVTPESERLKLAEIRAAQRDLLRPVGRPTKRDRRDWERQFEGEP